MKLLFISFICFISFNLHAGDGNGKFDLSADYLRTEYKVNPFTDRVNPRLSWEVKGEDNNRKQTAYQIVAAQSKKALDNENELMWNSRKVFGSETNQIHYGGKMVKSGQRIWWKVRLWDESGKVGDWSEPAYWELGLLNSDDWQARWIGKDFQKWTDTTSIYRLPPSPYLRKEMLFGKHIESARLYVASLGTHQFYVNGVRIGKDYFPSGWTDYNKRIYYQVYDITDEVKEGNNAMGAVLSEGWYAGYLGYALLVGAPTVKGFYGDIPLLKAQIEVKYTDGNKEILTTDSSWMAGTGGVRESDILQGETFDAGLEPENWHSVGFNTSGWEHADVYADKPQERLELYPGKPIRIVKELDSKSITRLENGSYIVDFGQNFAGVVRLKIKGGKGDTIRLRYGEMLHLDGTLMTENLRKARATDTYIMKGSGQSELWAPSFTYHGFQYVEVSGLKQKPEKDFLKGLVMSSLYGEAGHIETDNSMLNKLYSNIVWTQRANYMDIPTDCPQRDERLGWTGDAQIYMRSAIYNADVAAFHTKWLTDLQDAQWENGAYPVYAPMPKSEKGVAAVRSSDTFSPGWSEAGIICTYEYFRAYNDKDIVARSLPSMEKYMAFLKLSAKNGVLFDEGSFENISPKGGFGDWLSVGHKTSPDLLASMYYFYCATLMTEMCKAVQEDERAVYYADLSRQIRSAIYEHYMNEGQRFVVDAEKYGDGAGYVDGHLGFSGHTQTAYANAIYMGVLRDGLRAEAGKFLRELVEKTGEKLTTGFLGFKPLLPALSATGSPDQAYTLLLSEEYPSLGYEVINGATSIWERWDSYIKGEGFRHNAAMNSFSHYSFGAANEWMFESMLGIRPLAPGFSSFAIQPVIPNDSHSLRHVKGSYRAISGLIMSEWEKVGDKLIQKVQIPPNSTAFCYFSGDKNAIRINGHKLNDAPWVLSVKYEEDVSIVELGSGAYEFESEP